MSNGSGLVKRLSIEDIKVLDEGAVIGFRLLHGTIVKARVLSAPNVKMERTKSGRFARHVFYVPIEYRDPRTRTVKACHVTQGLRDLLVKGV